jgi:hypothetical protein
VWREKKKEVKRDRRKREVRREKKKEVKRDRRERN